MQTSLGEGKSDFPLCFLFPHTPLSFCRPSTSASSCLFAQQLQLSPFSTCTVVLQTVGTYLGTDHSGCSKHCLCILDRGDLPCLPHTVLALTGQTLRDAVKHQFLWLVLIFLLFKPVVTSGRIMLPLRAWATPDAASMFQGRCLQSAHKAIPFTFVPTQDEECRAGRELGSHLVQPLTATSQNDFIGKQKLHSYNC